MLGHGGPVSASALAGAVGDAAHDLNNLCTSIHGFTALIQESLPSDSPLQFYLAELMVSATRTVQLAAQLKALSQQTTEGS